MHFFQVCALVGMVTTNKVSHEGAFHNNQVYVNPVPIRSKAVKNFLDLCMTQSPELDCLLGIFNDDYFWHVRKNNSLLINLYALLLQVQLTKNNFIIKVLS